jgi:hypothetical protein
MPGQGVAARTRRSAIPRPSQGGDVAVLAQAAGAPPAEPAPPRLRTLAAVAGWAATLGLLGVVIAVRGVVAIANGVPGWYEPTLVLSGLGGMVLTVGSFICIRHRQLAWLLLTAASAALITTLVATAAAT